MALLSSGPLFSPTSLNSLLVALMGWMPSTIDVSVWHSFWCFERRKQVHYKPGMKEAFLSDQLMVSAVLFQFSVIGEAVNQVDVDLLSKYDYPWHKVKAFRNLISHVYFQIKLEAECNRKRKFQLFD